jgi:hypothetical protein
MMIQPHFGTINAGQLKENFVFRHADSMTPFLDEPADTTFFLVKADPNPDMAGVVEREVQDGSGGKVKKEFLAQRVEVFPFRWNPKTKLAEPTSKSAETKVIYFSTDTLEHAGFDEVQARVAKADRGMVTGLYVPEPKAIPGVAVARA